MPHEVNFGVPDKYKKEKAFTQVKFGEDGHLLEVELNEMQKIALEKIRDLNRAMFGNCALQGGSMSIESGKLKVQNKTVVVNGDLITIDTVYVTVASGNTVYVTTNEVEITATTSIKAGGNTATSTTVTNDLLDPRIGEESSRRIQLMYTLTTTKPTAGNYIELCKIGGTSPNFTITPVTYEDSLNQLEILPIIQRYTGFLTDLATTKKSNLVEATNEVLSLLNTHSADKVAHITATERTNWNAKETPSGAQARADKALTDAKAYAVSKNGDGVIYGSLRLDGAIRTTVPSKNSDANMSEYLLGLSMFALTGQETGYPSPYGEVLTYNDSLQRNFQIFHEKGKDALHVRTWHEDSKSWIGWTKLETTPEVDRKIKVHTDDNVRHITGAERTSWNGKADRATTYSMTETDDKINAVLGMNQELLETIKKITEQLEGNESAVGAIMAELDKKVDKVTGKGLSTNDYTTAEKTKLAGLNNYTHPATHPATMIVEDANKRFVSDSEKSTWNSKETTTGAQAKANQALADAKTYVNEGLAATYTLDLTALDPNKSYPVSFQHYTKVLIYRKAHQDGQGKPSVSLMLESMPSAWGGNSPFYNVTHRQTYIAEANVVKKIVSVMESTWTHVYLAGGLTYTIFDLNKSTAKGVIRTTDFTDNNNKIVPVEANDSDLLQGFFTGTDPVNLDRTSRPLYLLNDLEKDVIDSHIADAKIHKNWGNWDTNGSRDLRAHGKRVMVAWEDAKDRIDINYNGDFKNGVNFTGPVKIEERDVLHTGWALMREMGSTTPQNDWNAITETGFYLVTNGTGANHANYPAGAYAYGTLEVYRSNSNQALMQRYTTHTGAAVYVRSAWAKASWSAWRKISDESYVDQQVNAGDAKQLSKAGDTLTGMLIMGSGQKNAGGVPDRTAPTVGLKWFYDSDSFQMFGREDTTNETSTLVLQVGDNADDSFAIEAALSGETGVRQIAKFSWTNGFETFGAIKEAGTALSAKYAGYNVKINSGAGLLGGSNIGTDTTLSVNFGGNGTATQVARSDHNHDTIYAKLSHGTHVPTPQTADNYKFLRNDNTWQSLPWAGTGQGGVVQLTNATNSTSEIQAPTALALKTVYDLANGRETTGGAQSKANTAETNAKNYALGITGDKTKLNTVNKTDLTSAINEINSNYDVTRSGIDANGIATVVEWANSATKVRFRRSELSNPDANGNYRTGKIMYYTNGTTIAVTENWTYSYDANGNLTSEVKA